MGEKPPIRRYSISFFKQIGADIEAIERGLWELEHNEAIPDSTVIFNMRRSARSLLKAIESLEHFLLPK